nr:uncharacterized protein LOC112018486 [Quercus suber]
MQGDNESIASFSVRSLHANVENEDIIRKIPIEEDLGSDEDLFLRGYIYLKRKRKHCIRSWRKTGVLRQPIKHRHVEILLKPTPNSQSSRYSPQTKQKTEKSKPLRQKLCFLHHVEPPPPHSLIAGAERRKNTKFTLKTPLQTDSKQNEERNPALRKKLLAPHLCFLHAEPLPLPHRSPEQNDFEEDRVLAVSSGLCRPLLAQTPTTPHTGAHRHRVCRSCAWSLETNRSRREPRSKGWCIGEDCQGISA